MAYSKLSSYGIFTSNVVTVQLPSLHRVDVALPGLSSIPDIGLQRCPRKDHVHLVVSDFGHAVEQSFGLFCNFCSELFSLAISWYCHSRSAVRGDRGLWR